jgi:serine/threonine protein kinase
LLSHGDDASFPMTDEKEESRRIGTIVADRYRVDALLGRGGMGAVYRAEDLDAARSVALKILRRHLVESAEATARFQREALVGGKLTHPNCVGVTDVGSCADGAVYLTMELLEGESLGDVLQREGALPWRRALHIVRHVLEGLGHAHALGIVHRDIKPDNIFLCPRDGDSDLARVLDFGIAKLVGGAEGPAITQAGLTVGTPDYLSPEQASGGQLDGRSDLYAVSVVLFELLTGKAPFEDPDPIKVLMAHAVRPPPRLSEAAPALDLPMAVEVLLHEGLAKLPEERIATAAAYIARIDAILTPVDSATETTIDAGVGEILDGRYRLESLLGRGTMGRVYRASHLGLRRAVAIKLLEPRLVSDDTARKRFEREARMAGQLRQPNCVAVTDFGTASNGTSYLVMELADGTNLADIVANETRLSVSRALHIMRHLLAGLAHAHGLGIVHRDIKPANIVLVEDGDDRDFAKILDFGLARMFTEDDRVTATGIVLGSPTYMSPEHVVGRPLDGRADLYAVSVILFEMLAGRPPFESDEVRTLLKMQMSAPVPRIADVAPGVVVPDALEALIRRGLAKRANERPASAEAYLAEMERAAPSGSPTIELSALDSAILPVAPPPSLPPGARVASVQSRVRFDRRRGIAAAAIVGVAVVGVAIASMSGGRTSSGPPATRAMVAPDDEIEIAPSAARDVATDIANALELSRKGRGEEAASRLRELRKKRPGDAMVPFALGQVYGRLNWPKQTIDAYRDAMRMDPALRDNDTLIEDLVGLLASRSSWQLAARVIEQDLGAAALPFLSVTAERHPDGIVRGRAAKLQARLAR